ncbi:hypothetical protein F5X99DRAFT_329255 [Biscogniauxia marginata]|nr:hypothetical protein F5X99DRAFT_329255 [Biscogniauxia marginata]
MPGTYDIQTYLLDRANIHDTIFRMVLAFDTRSPTALVGSVYAPVVHIDYTQILGGSAKEISSSEWAKSLEPVLGQYDSTQHTVSDLLVELPQPGPAGSTSAAPRPDTCSVVAYANAWLYHRDSEGGPRVMVRRNGGRYELQLVRVTELEEKGQNPWRISKQKMILAYQDKGVDE